MTPSIFLKKKVDMFRKYSKILVTDKTRKTENKNYG